MNFLSAEKKEKYLKVVGKMPDRDAGKILGVSKSTVQGFRRRNEIPPFGKSRTGPKKKTDKEQVQARERGYPNHTVALQWEENRKLQDMLDSWPRFGSS